LIQVSQIISRVESFLDAEGSDRYKFEQDYKPAINSAIEFLISVFNKAFSDNKLTEENLRELVLTRVWQTSKYSRIYFDPNDVGGDIWSLIRISPEPTLDPAIDPLGNDSPELSLYVPDVVFVRSRYAANRLTFEEYSESERNIFVDGNDSFSNDFKSYAYINFNDNAGLPEIEILPAIDNQFVAVTYLLRPSVIVSDTDSIRFPESMTNLVVKQVLNYLSTKQGDGTTLYSITEKDVSELVSVMS